MKKLNAAELQIAERFLQKHLPKSLKVYGYLYGINRDKPHTRDVLVDSWPQFKVIICRPNGILRGKQVSLYSTDETALRQLLAEDDAVDWSVHFMFGGFDTSYAPLLREVASAKGVNMRTFTSVHLLSLSDCNRLPTLPIQSEIEPRISSLNESHVDLVNKTWKFGGHAKAHHNIKHLISNHLSCCIMDDEGQPVSWILLYDYNAMGMLYVMPEHRGKGYAKVLISSMAKKLHALGYPAYCFIEEENTVSYKLFKDMGFTEDPSYRAAWFEMNF